MASGNGKKSLKQKFSGAARKFLLAIAFASAVGGPAYYEYGTVREKEVKITAVDKAITGYNSNANDDPDNNDYFYVPPPPTPVYKVTGYETNIGPFKNENTKLHLKSNAGEIEKTLEAGKTYRIRFYGKKFTSKLTPNILAAREVTDAELKARAEQKKIDEEKQKTARVPTAPTANSSSPNAPAQQCANGDVAVIERILGGNRVQIIFPIEAAGKVIVTSVQSPTPRPPSP